MLACAAVPVRAASDVTVSAASSSGGAFSGGNPNVFTPSAATANVDRATIQTSLNGGNAVTVNSASPAGGNGDVTVAASVAKTAGASATLMLNAVRDLTVNAAISASIGPLPLALNAGRAISSTAVISTNGANITIDTVQPFTLGSSLNAGAGQVLLQSGALQSSSYQTVTASSVQVSSGTTWNLYGTVSGALNVAGTISPGTTVSSLQVNGEITLQSSATTVVDLNGGSDTITATGAVTVAGALQLNFLSGFENTITNGYSFTILSGASITGTFTGLPNNSRITLPNELGSVKITYNATNVVLSDWQPYIRELTWDPGTADAGTQVLTNTSTRAGRHYFHINVQSTDIGAWKTRLAVTTGEANLYLRNGAIPQSTGDYNYRSERVGSDGIVLPGNYYTAGQDWYLMVHAPAAGAQWSIFSGRAWVQDLGTLAWTDNVIANGQYDIGEPALPSGTGGNVALGPEGIRFFRTIVPTGTPHGASG